MIQKLITRSVLLAVALSGIPALAAEILIPRTMADKGTYYLLESNATGGIRTTLHKRVGVNETGYSKTEINCKTMQYRDMGYSEVAPEKIVVTPGNWTSVIPGSSKSDLVNFVCSRK